MSTWRKQINHHKSISWLLVTAILLVTFLPAHYHLHHLFNDGSNAYTNTTDLHLTADKMAQSHHDEGATIIKAAPNGLLSKWDGELNKPDFSPLVILVSLLTLFSLFNLKRNPRPYHGVVIYKQIYYRLSPPPRAPPLN